MKGIVGIDLGTTNSLAAVWRDGAPQLVRDADGEDLTPSVVAIHDGGIVVGRKAREVAGFHPELAVYSIKRLMGRRYGESTVQQDLLSQHLLYEVNDSPERTSIQVKLGERSLTPQQISAVILQKLKTDAEVSLGQAVSEAVITVPAYFNDSQRQATRDAGQIAGFTVKRILNEPTAACLAFAYKRLAEARRTVAVFDLGGGTFDVSILEIGHGPFSVLATNGDTHLGGDDFNEAIVQWSLGILREGERDMLRNHRPSRARSVLMVRFPVSTGFKASGNRWGVHVWMESKSSFVSAVIRLFGSNVTFKALIPGRGLVRRAYARYSLRVTSGISNPILRPSGRPSWSNLFREARRSRIWAMPGEAPAGFGAEDGWTGAAVKGIGSGNLWGAVWVGSVGIGSGSLWGAVWVGSVGIGSGSLCGGLCVNGEGVASGTLCGAVCEGGGGVAGGRERAAGNPKIAASAKARSPVPGAFAMRKTWGFDGSVLKTT